MKNYAREVGIRDQGSGIRDQALGQQGTKALGHLGVLQHRLEIGRVLKVGR
jgi:hypothetical protein